MSAHNISILEPLDYSKEALAKLETLGEVYFGFDQAALSVCTILVVRLKFKIDADLLRNSPNLQYVLSATTGTDHIDISYCDARNIKVVCLKGEVDFLGGIPSTAEHTWALLMALVRHIPSANKHVQNFNWDRNQFRGHNLNALRLGILGLGRVGKQVANYASAFGMEIHAFDVNKTSFITGIKVHSSFEEFAKSIDVLTIHIPLDNTTEHWLNEERLNLLNKGSYIINTSRGKVWDEEHVVRLLKSNHLGGCASDVVELEQEGEGIFQSPLIKAMHLNLPVIITPHIAGATFESMAMTENFVVDKFINSFMK